MNPIKAIYKIPEIKHVFVIRSGTRDFSDSPTLSKKNITELEFGRILRSKPHSPCKIDQSWTYKEVSEHEFLNVLRLHNSSKNSSEKTFLDPENLELLAINITPSHNSQKALCSVPLDDVIEIFI